MEKIDIKSLQLEQLKEYITSLGAKAFVAGQIYTWLHEKCVDSFDEMSNISKNLRQKLEEECYITTISIRKKQVSKDGTIRARKELGTATALSLFSAHDCD